RRPVSTLFPYTTLFRSRSTEKGTCPSVEAPRAEEATESTEVFIGRSFASAVCRLWHPWGSAPTTVRPSAPRRTPAANPPPPTARSEEHTSELQSRFDLV